MRFAVAALITMSIVAPAVADEKIKVLIVDGQNNHDWRSTTPILLQALEGCGRFTVAVATSPQIPSLPKPAKPKKERA